MQFVKLMWSRIIGMIVQINPVLPSNAIKKLPNAIEIGICYLENTSEADTYICSI